VNDANRPLWSEALDLDLVKVEVCTHGIGPGESTDWNLLCHIAQRLLEVITKLLRSLTRPITSQSNGSHTSVFAHREVCLASPVPTLLRQILIRQGG
jgi:hypothetical protein